MGVTLVHNYLLLLLLITSGVLNQNEYKMVFERVEVVDFNTSYVAFANTHNFKYNRTTAVTNVTFKLLRDLVGKLDMEVQAYKMASNEYRPFPLRFSFDFCNYASKNEFGLGDMYKCGNLTGCPFKKGVNHICNWSINATKCPPHMVAGSYMFDLKFIYRGIVGLFYQLYATVKYPEIKVASHQIV